MPIFEVKNKKLTRVQGKAFLEKDIQVLTEENLKEIFGLQFISGKLNKQFSVKNSVLDTLAFDPDSKAFVILEYKKEESFSVVDQGMSYLSLMVNNKAEFILEYNEKFNSNLKRKDVDWSQSRVIFIAPKFTAYQIGATAFKDFPIELWEVSFYENNIVEYDRVKAAEAVESIKTISKGKGIKAVSREIKSYQTEDLIKPSWKKTQALFNTLDNIVLRLQFPGSQRRVLKFYIAYTYEGEPSFLEVVPQANGLKLYIRPKIHELPKKSGFLLRDCSKVGHWTNGNTYLVAKTDYEVMEFIKFLRNIIVHK